MKNFISILVLVLVSFVSCFGQTRKNTVKSFKTDTLDVSAISLDILEVIKTSDELSRIEMVIIIENGNIPTATANSILTNKALANNYNSVDGSDYRKTAKTTVSQNRPTNEISIVYKGTDVRIKRVYRVVVGKDTKILMKSNTAPSEDVN